MRKAVAGATAALGAVCLILAPMATVARADAPPLPIYQATGISQGVLTTLTLKPSIFDPLLEIGTAYTKTNVTSEGGGISHSLAAQVYPGSLVVGFAGCGGSGIPQIGGTITKGWVQASYPAGGGCNQSTHTTLAGLPSSPLTQIASISGGNLSASAGQSAGGAAIETARFNVAGGTQQVLSIGSMITSTNAVATSKAVENVVTSTAKDISLLGGLLKIGTLTSTSIATSDGTNGGGSGTLTFGDATINANGATHSISIDNTGIHSDDPTLSRAQNLSLSEQINDLLVQAGITLAAATPSKIIDGASSESSVGGLTISLDATVPSVPVPQELAPILAKIVNAIRTQCLSDFHIPAPICFGPGILPGLGSEARITFTIGSTDAFAVGGLGLTFNPGGNGCPTCIPGTGPIVGPTIAPPIISPTGPLPVTSLPTVQGTQQYRLFGLVARLPAVALLWGGLVLLVLALGFAYGPSLRHARAR